MICKCAIVYFLVFCLLRENAKYSYNIPLSMTFCLQIQKFSDHILQNCDAWG